MAGLIDTMVITALFAFAPTPQSAEGQGVPAPTFRVNGVTFTMTPPAGYCFPTGKAADVAQIAAAADTSNVTSLSLFSCDEPIVTGAGDYTLIKTPVGTLTASVTRPELLAAVGAEFDKPEFAKFIASEVSGQATAGLKRVLPVDLKLDGTVKALGRDETCAYMGGTVTFNAPNVHYVQAVGICITSIGGRVITINRYGKKTAAADILTLLQEAKALVANIKPVAD